MKNQTKKTASTKKAKPSGAVFRPSVIPKLEECIYFQSKSTEGNVYTGRGNEKHRIIAEVLMGHYPVNKITNLEHKRDAAWVKQMVEQRGLTVHFTEKEYPLVISGKTVWTCTVDVVALDQKNGLWIIDHKTGDERDYTGQYAAYGKAVMLDRNRLCAVFLELNLDLRKDTEFDMTLSDCTVRTDAIYGEWLTRGMREDPYTINQYCDWCALQGECPAWRESAKTALAILPDAPLKPLEQRVEEMKKDPVALGEFMSAYKRLETLVVEWKLKEAILEYLQNDPKRECVPGWSLRKLPTRKVPSVYDLLKAGKALDEKGNEVELPCEVFMRMVKTCGTDNMEQFLKISSVEALEEVWQTFFPSEEMPIRIDVIENPGFTVAVKPPPGRGRAAAAIKERAKGDK
jgi:hypothetical protein